jgi:hypothetical protein
MKLEAIEYPANRLTVLGLEGRDHRSEGTSILG